MPQSRSIFLPDPVIIKCLLPVTSLAAPRNLIIIEIEVYKLYAGGFFPDLPINIGHFCILLKFYFQAGTSLQKEMNISDVGFPE
jgi:hypothetical protein